MNKGISTPIGIIIIVLVALMAGGIIFWQYFGLEKKEIKAPEEKIIDETADWQTYRNEEYGFEIKYPEEARLLEFPSKIVITLSPETPIKEKQLTISFGSTSLDCADNWPMPKVIKTEEIYISNVKFLKEIGYQYECDVPEGKGYAGACYFDVNEEGKVITGKYVTVYSSTRYSTKKENLCFFLNFLLSPYSISDSDYKKEADIFNQMLSTFRFLE